MKKIFLLSFLFLSVSGFTQTQKNNDVKAITELMDRQAKEWNRGNIDGFMKGYWDNDSLMFIGKSGITYGYDSTLLNYKKGYSDTSKMGKLSLTMLHIRKLSPEYYFVVGKWHLKRSIGDIGGHYTLLFRKINGKWVIVADHSS